MTVSSARVILAPILRANEVVCIGPFRKPDDHRKSTGARSAYKIYTKTAWFFIFYMIIRKFLLVAYKSKYARHLLETDTDLLRAPMIISMIVLCSRLVNKYEKAFDMYDKFPHDDSADAWLTRAVQMLTGAQWVYSFSRVLIDLLTFFDENNLPKYIRNQLFMDPTKLNTGLYVLAGAYAIFHLALERLVTSMPLTIIIFTYLCVNLLTDPKLRHLEKSFTECLTRKPFSLDEFSRLRLRHADLCQLVLYLDGFLSPLALIFHSGTVIGVCLFVGRFVQRYKSGLLANGSVFDTVSFGINLFYMLFLLTIVTMTAAAICEASERLTKLLNELLEDHEAEDLELESQQVRLLLSQMNVKDVQMTAWRFYNLDRSALMKTFASVVTYVSLILESA